MKNKLSDEQNETILKALNDAIEKGPWQESNFLKVIGKKLTKIRDDFLSQLGASNPAQLKIETQLASRMAARSGQKEVFISLYSSDGANLQSWERIIVNLPRQMISRPIYSNEEDIKEAMKHKENKVNEAYVAIFINPSDILFSSSDRVVVDKLGKKLLMLKDKSLTIHNISRFVHQSGTYLFVHNRLIKN